MEDIITKYTQVLPRSDGSEVKLVARAYFGAGLHLSVGVDVFSRVSPDSDWHLCNDRPHPNWREMSVEEYCRRGRSEKFQAATHGEIFKVTNMIGKPVSGLPPDVLVQ